MSFAPPPPENSATTSFNHFASPRKYHLVVAVLPAQHCGWDKQQRARTHPETRQEIAATAACKFANKLDSTSTNLLRLQVAYDGADVGQDLLDEGHHFTGLHLYEVPPAFLCDLDERVARHVLNAVVRLWKKAQYSGFACFFVTKNAPF